MPNKLYILVVSSIFFTISDIFFSISCVFPKISCMYLLYVLDILQQVFLSETARHTEVIPKDGVTHIQSAVDSVFRWSRSNKLQLNVDKCK